MSESFLDASPFSDGDFEIALEAASLGRFVGVEAFEFGDSLAEEVVVSLAFLELLLDEDEFSSGIFDLRLELEDDDRLLLVLLTDLHDKEITFLELSAKAVNLSVEELNLLSEVD